MNTDNALITTNGSQLAILMHRYDILANGLTVEDCTRLAIENNLVPASGHKRLNSDDFWEDFIYTAEDDLGYKLAL
jgi:hypothetical protein